MAEPSIAGWAAGIAALVAALVGLFFASKLNKLTRGGVVGSSIGYVMFGFVVLAITALFDELVAFAQPLLPYSAADLGVAKDLLRLLAMIFFAAYFYRVYRAFAGYAARRNQDAAA